LGKYLKRVGDGFKKEEVAALLEYKDELEKKYSILKKGCGLMAERMKAASIELKKIITDDQ
jgi:hypothetical protein